MGSEPSKSSFLTSFHNEYSHIPPSSSIPVNCQLFKHKVLPLFHIKSLQNLPNTLLSPLSQSKLLLPIPNLFPITHISSPNEEELHCGRPNQIILYSQFSPINLAQEVKRRKLAQEPFSEPELWYLLKALFETGTVMQQVLRVGFGVLNVENIYLDLEGHIKFLHPVFYMDRWGENKGISEVFLAGISVLNAAGLSEEVLEFSQRNLEEFDKRKFEEALYRLKRVYSPLFVNILAEMLFENPSFQELQVSMEGLSISNEFTAVLNAFESSLKEEKNPKTPLYIRNNPFKYTPSPINQEEPLPFNKENITNKGLLRTKPTFVTPRKVLLLNEASPIMKLAFETPEPIKTEIEKGFAKLNQGFDNIEREMKGLMGEIDDALGRSRNNRNKYNEIYGKYQ